MAVTELWLVDWSSQDNVQYIMGIVYIICRQRAMLMHILTFADTMYEGLIIQCVNVNFVINPLLGNCVHKKKRCG